MTKITPAKKAMPAVAAKPNAALKPKPVVPAKPVTQAKPASNPKIAATQKVLAPVKNSAPTKVAPNVQKAGPSVPTRAPAATNSSGNAKVKKSKLVRDSFTMPEEEYAALGEVKKACLKAGVAVKKSELLRVGVAHIRKMDLAVLKQAVAALAPLKAGRPKKDK